MEDSIVLYEKIGRVARIWLNRPQAINALTAELIQELKNAIDRLSKDTDVRVAIIAGKGEKGFCAGFDLNLSAVLFAKRNVSNCINRKQRSQRGHMCCEQNLASVRFSYSL